MNAVATDTAIGMQTWKTSCFVWFDGATARNDLTDEVFELPADELRILSDLKTAPADLTQMAERLLWDPERTAAVVRQWIEQQLIVPSTADEGKEFSVKRVDIETGSHCNARCGFCPQSERPKPKHFMTLDLFDRVVQQIAPYRPAWVALNNFSEPLLDPYFVERCRRLDAHGLKVALFTNATVLKPNVIEYISTSQVLYSVTINFPSDDPEEWGNLMGLPSATHARTVENIATWAKVYKGGIGIVVNGATDNLDSRIERIGVLFARFPNVTVLKQGSNTLAGNIQNDLVAAATLVKNRRLGGCPRLAAHVHVSWQGDVFMCCLDYSQEVKFGNLAEASLGEILSGPIAVDHRRQVYGLAEAEPHLLCRTCCHIRH
jgi:sulfatase maturation enzyme AslB (radical SAM superfamily)